MLGFILWNVDPEIFSIGPLHVRYYGLMFGIGFYIGYKIFSDIVKREKLPEEWVEKLFIYTIVGTVVGARLGHCLFYQPHYYLTHPIEILKIWEGGLASHGGALGVLLALIVFSKKVSKRSVFWVLDRIVLGVALTAALIRFGNLMNSEIYGYPTDSKFGVVYLKDTRFAHMLEDGSELAKFVDDYNVEKVDGDSPDGGESWPVMFNVTLKQGISDEKQADAIARYIIKNALNKYIKEDGAETNVYVEPDVNPELKIFKGHWMASFPAFVIPKHPTQIYESLCYLFGFVLLMFLYYKTNLAEKKGLLFGIFLIITFLSRFVIEFVKENQVNFEKGMSLNMGQWLSIPFIIAGIILVIRPFMSKTREN
ncbi:prolipoprotein diacylglyceryl transferase [Saccharicrinis sp. FJH2]|uniref:prolipoprotein diacylglyceryl transferase n=1 Tax=Saccharicrinis sp. FJH65 TaxID=3344659 RepID=UPI0035F290DF